MNLDGRFMKIRVNDFLFDFNFFAFLMNFAQHIGERDEPLWAKHNF